MVWSAPTIGARDYMAEIGKFTQPDASPTYFIDFLDFLDKREAIQNMRAESAKRLSLAPGHRVLDLGCGIGEATIPLAETFFRLGILYWSPERCEPRG